MFASLCECAHVGQVNYLSIFNDLSALLHKDTCVEHLVRIDLATTVITVSVASLLTTAPRPASQVDKLSILIRETQMSNY